MQNVIIRLIGSHIGNRAAASKMPRKLQTDSALDLFNSPVAQRGFVFYES